MQPYKTKTTQNTHFEFEVFFHSIL